MSFAWEYDENFADEELLEEEGISYLTNRFKALKPYHLNSALTPHWWNDLKSRDTRKGRHLLYQFNKINSKSGVELDQCDWKPAEAYLFLSSFCVILDPMCFEDDAVEMTKLLTSAEQRYWQGKTEILTEMTIEGLSDALRTPHYRMYKLQANFFSSIVMIMNALASNRNLPSLPRVIQLSKEEMSVINLGGDVSIYITDIILVVKKPSGKHFVMNYDSMLMCSDIAKQRRLVMLMSSVGNKIFPTVYPTQDKLAELFSILDEGLRAHGNNFYKIIKIFEPLCVGAIMKTKEDHFVDNTEFFSTIINDTLKDEPQFGVHLDILTEFLVSEKNPSWLCQYFGLYRLWGHPVVNVREGIKKVMDLGMKRTFIDEKVARQAARHFKYIMLTNYWKRKHRYPPYSVTGKEDCWLFQRLSFNKELPRPGTEWCLHELDYLNFEELFKPPATFNLTSIIADKAVSPSRKELKTMIKQNKNSDPALRRGVLKWLGMEHVSCKEILKMVNENEFCDDWCIIGVYPKEREENIKPRLFALMSFELRLYVVVTEEMLADHILEYFPQITMTHSQLDLTKSIFTATRHQSTEYSKKSSNLVTISVSMDFEKWNIKMRKEATDEVFEQLGRLFGLPNLYKATHDILTRCFIYLADGSYMPDKDLTPDFVYSWIGHLGGFEGLRQKGWTIFTACLIDYVCSSHDVSYKLMGQGDNQVVQLIFRLNHTKKGSSEYDPRDVDHIKRKIEKILKELEETFSSVGMTLKISETWRSSHLFSYGKTMVFDGVPIPLSMKKCARAFCESNEGIMVMDSMMATVSTNCQAAAYQDLSHHVAYAIARFENYIMCRRLIEYHPLIGSGLRTYHKNHWTSRGVPHPHGVVPDIKLLAAVMTVIPRMLGGYNTTCLYEYIMRGFPDPLTRDLCYVRLLLRGLKEETSPEGIALFELIGRWYLIYPNDDIDKSFLIQDPLAINIKGPRSPMDSLRDSVENILSSSKVKNKPFMRLVKMKNDGNMKKLAEVLWTAKRINARLYHDIYQATSYGYVKQSLSRIENTNTIRNIAMESSKKDIVEVICDAEVQKYLFFIWKSSVGTLEELDGVLSICTRIYAQQLRNITWEKEIIGVTVPFPDEYLKMSYEATEIKSEEDGGYFVVGFNEHSVKSKDHMLTHLGPSPPYLGSVTREKTRQTSDMMVFKAEPLIRRPLHLQRSIGWFVPPESKTADLIRETVRSVSDLDPVDFQTTEWESTGSHIHRYHDTVTKKGVLINYSYLPGTHMYISSDMLVKYSQSRANVNIVYQACLVYEQYLAWILQLERLSKGKSPLRLICWSIVCDCITEVDEGFDDIETPGTGILPSNEGNELLWISSNDLIVHHSKKLGRDEVKEPVTMEFLTTKQQTELFHYSFGKRIAQDIFSGELDENAEAKMVDNASRYPRVYYSKVSLNKLVAYVLLWYKVFMYKRVGRITLDMSQLTLIEEKMKERIDKVPSVLFQGLGLIFTNRDFCSDYYPQQQPSPNTSPYTLYSVGKAMKQYTLNFMSNDPTRYIDKDIEYLPVEFGNLRDEVLTCTVFRLLAREEHACALCFVEINRLMYEDNFKTICTEHSTDELISDGVVKLRYYPVTVDKLSKAAERIIYLPKRRPPISYENIPSCRMLISGLNNSIRSGHSTAVEDDHSEFPLMGVEWQKYCKSGLFPTASRYKWSCVMREIVQRFQFDDALIFGDGLGGISDLTNLFFPHAKITVMSFMQVSDAINHSTIGCIPPEYKGDTTRLDVFYQANRINDVTSPSFLEDWESCNRNFDVLFSDVELPRDIEDEVYFRYISNLCGLGIKMACFKIYLNKVSRSINALAKICQTYSHVDLITCSTANLHYNECFVLCSIPARDSAVWHFSEQAFREKLVTTFMSNNPDKWDPYQDSLTLEKNGWVESMKELSKQNMLTWLNTYNLSVLLFRDDYNTDKLVKAMQQTLSIYRRKNFGTRAKIPRRILTQIAQRALMISLAHENDIPTVRRYLQNPERIKLVITSTTGAERIAWSLEQPPYTSIDDWTLVMKYVAVARRMFQLGI
ncbi:TPA_asm: L [Alnus trirhavirus 1]|nr:TPA_asm: L [Alnus trirhavirus 1]